MRTRVRSLATLACGVGVLLHPRLDPGVATQGQGAGRGFTIVEEQRYGGADGSPGELVRPTTLGVDGAGRLYVADVRPIVVKVYNPDGTFLRTIGREGGGPGEFRVAWIAVRGSNLVVHDPTQSRTSVFDTSGKYLRSWQSFCCHQNEIAIDEAGRIVVPTSLAGGQDASASGLRRVSYARFRLDGTPVDTLHLDFPGAERLWTVRRGGSGTGPKPGGYTSMVIPFTPSLVFAWHPAGGLVRGFSSEYRIVRSRDGRDSTTIVSRRWSPRPIPARIRQAKVDTARSQFAGMVGAAQARQAVRLADVPATEPAFIRLFVDEEGNVWARRLLGGDATHTPFDVWSPAGQFLGEATLPADVPEWGGAYFGKGVVYVRSEDEDGRPLVVRYRVRRTGP